MTPRTGPTVPLNRPQQKQLFAPEPDRPEWEQVAEDDRLVAEIALLRPMEKTFDYLVPEPLRDLIGPGQRVAVPFGAGNRSEPGFCVGLSRRATPHRKLKSISELIDRHPLVDEHLLQLTRWMAERYLCSWGQALETAVPAGVKNQAGTREMTFFALAPDIDELVTTVKLPVKQAAVVDYLRTVNAPLRGQQITEAVGCGPGPINGLRDKGLIVATRLRANTFEADIGHIEREADIELNPDQRRALASIRLQLHSNEARTFVLHGVTGSGKTEVYIQAIREVVEFGRQAIVMVPEISLTPQTIRRFRSRFDAVAVLHSHLTDAERHWHWRRIGRGEVQVIVGARSAVFAPAPHLGLIVIDEEHENSFKQDSAPRYHAREVARHRAELCGIPLILGTATPTLESWVRVGHESNTDTLLSLPSRVSGLPLPPVTLVDLRNDPLCSKGHAIGRALRTAIQTALRDKGQIILFLNLRGYSPTVWCRSCSAGVKCPNCDITFTLHRDRNIILCHTCGLEAAPPDSCPACGKPGIRYFGTGTQRLEQEVKSKFPGHRVIRMDSDTMQRRGSHDEALEIFRRGEAEILVGTQMIAKGLDFPNVTLVGVVDADTVLHQPDLRASERTFQLISQVAGRAGRSERGGRVFVQTCAPTDVAIEHATRHDFLGFAAHELKNRREMDSPPFRHWVRVILRGPIEEAVQSVALDMADVLREVVDRRKLDIRVLGPAPCPVGKLQSNYRFHFLLSALDLQPVRDLWRELRPALPSDRSVEFVLDVDPINMR
jgi:primosomal protein N' (replication factor Y)